MMANGYLQLDFQKKGGRTILAEYRQKPPLRVVRAFELPEGAALVHLHNLSGGVLGGDKLELQVQIGENAHAQLTTTGATRLYRKQSERATAQQINNIRVEKGGLLEYLPDSTIPFGGSEYRQETTVTLQDDAGLIWWELIAPGREARGELFEYKLLQLSFEIWHNHKPLLLERNRLEPARNRLDSPARLGKYRYYASFYLCRVGLEKKRWKELEQEMSALAEQLSCVGESVWGIGSLVEHGLVARGLCVSGRQANAGLLELWRVARKRLYGLEAIPPRKIY